MALVPRRRGIVLGAAAWTLAQPAAAQPRAEVAIALASGSMAAALPRVAKELGLFEAHGLDVRLVIMDSSSAAITALISGSVKFINSGVPELLVAQARGQPVVALSNTYAGFATSLVLAKPVADKLGLLATAPVADRLKALNGLVIASTSATAIGTVAFRRAAQAAGANVRFTYMGQQAMPAALASGAVQGFASSAPYWAFPVADGSGTLWISGPQGQFPPEFTPQITAQLQTLRDTAHANPALATTLATVLGEVSRTIAARPAEVKAAVARLYPGLEPAILDLLFASESLGWVAGPATAAAMSRELGTFKASGGAQGQELDRVDPAKTVFP